MKIDSIGNIHALSILSIAKINEDDKKNKQISIHAPGYKTKNGKLILKLNSFVVNNIYCKDSRNNDETASEDEQSGNENSFDAVYDSIRNVLFHKDIPEETRKKVESLLEELNKYQEDNCSPVKVYINKNNIDDFIAILNELWINELYFGRITRNPLKEEGHGEVIDYKV
jgi:hypothetical protein